MQEIIDIIGNFGVSVAIVILFLYDWFTTRKDMQKTLEQNSKCLDEISPVIDVTYKKDIDTMITNIEQAILSQGGNI